MFRVAIVLLGVALCHVAALSIEPSTELIGVPWINPSSAFVRTVTTTVQVPLYIVRTTTVWGQGAVSTVYLPGQPQATVTRTQFVPTTVTRRPAGGAQTQYITTYVPISITVPAAQQLVAVETVTQYVAPSEFGVTRTIVTGCSNTVTRTRTRTRTRGQQYSAAYLTTGSGGSMTQIQTQTEIIPSKYLKF